ncbi:MAG: hypothetical protein KBD01_17745 [Acidobacteria bacterium]|nr:hypothetical protein [Acidobacteriota bacterium]
MNWDTDPWPWDHEGVRVLPVLHGRLEFARAVRAHLDAYDPQAVVVEIPRAAAEPWLRGVAALPRIQAVRIEAGGGPLWLVIEPCDPAVEAARWALARGRAVVAADLVAGEYGRYGARFPDPSVLPVTGYAAYARACLLHGPRAPRDPADDARERSIAAAAAGQARRGRVAVVVGLEHLQGVIEHLRGGAAVPLARPRRFEAGLLPLAPECLVEVLAEPPFVQAAWERARAGEPACRYESPAGPAELAPVLEFSRAAPRAQRTAAPDADLAEERRAAERGDDALARPRLLYRLVQQAARFARETSGSEPTLAERRVLHRFARNLALLEGRLCPDLYELVVAARGAVDDRFARDLLRVASLWPWQRGEQGGVRLAAGDLGLGSRLVTLRPRIDRLARRPSLSDALRRAQQQWEQDPGGMCSHVPEDLVVEEMGQEVSRRGGARASRSGVQVTPFTAGLLDGLDARETLRRWLTDGRPWVREDVAARAKVGAVVIVFEEDAGPARERKFGWQEVWHGEHQNESDMAFYASDPEPGLVAPGIHRAEYGGFLLVWPPHRLGDVWHDPAYGFCRTPAERLIVAAIDYSREPLVAVVARRAPRPELLGLARRMGRRVVHVPVGVFSADRLRRLRTFHVLAGKHLRPIAEWLLDDRP